jgi:type VI secretion system protein ImpH
VPTKKWPYPTRVIDRLQNEFYRFDFFQAMRIFERSLALQGEQGPVVGRVVCFKNSLNLAFPPSQIENLVRLDDEETEDGQGRPRYALTPAFFGLTGPAGALPRLYTEKLIERESLHRDYAARAFLDIFSNRMLTSFYEAWKKYRLRVFYPKDQKSGLLPHVLSLVGARPLVQDTPGRKKVAGELSIETIAFYAGILRLKTVSAFHLEKILVEYFRLPILVTQFLGQWIHLEPRYQASLSSDTTQLGVNSYCGERIWDRQKKLRISVGPLSRAQWNDFLPTGTARVALAQFLAATTGRGYQYELQLILKKEEVDQMQLSASNPVHLGWDSFLVSRPQTEDRGDAFFNIRPWNLAEDCVDC